MVGRIEYRDISDLILLKNNPRKITKANFEKLVDSIRINGFWEHRAIPLSDRTGKLVVLAGYQRIRASKKLKIKQVPTILYSELTEEQEKEIILRDNVNNGEWDESILRNDPFFSNLDFDFMGVPCFMNDKLKKSNKKGADLLLDDENLDSNSDYTDDDEFNFNDKEAFYRSMLDDVIYESNNDFEIPNLLLEHQAGKLTLPLAPWGADSRLRKGISTYYFYVDDYRFEAIWKDPVKVLISGVKSLVEPNLSLYDTTPIAYGLHQIYKKRWISRYFQECGILIYADLNVSVKFAEYNKLGIPDGYNAFFTRGYSDRIEYLKSELQIAKDISGKNIPNLIVYGGGNTIRQFCVKNSLVYVEQFMNNKKQ